MVVLGLCVVWLRARRGVQTSERRLCFLLGVYSFVVT